MGGAVMERHVEDVNVYVEDGGTLRQVGQGVTHYRFSCEGHFVGWRMQHELIAAGLPPSIQVTHYPDTDTYDVAIPGDDHGKMRAKITKVVGKHEGTEAADHKALLEFAGSIHDAARRMAEGGQVSPAERDIVMGVLAGRVL